MRSTLTTLALVLKCGFACAEEQTLRFPEHMCAITLPESSEWRVLPRQLVNDPESILVAIASDGKVSANLSVVALELDDEKEAEEVVKFQVAGMKAGGLEVTAMKKKDFLRVPGWLITSKGPVNGNDTVQTTWTLFANNRVYMVTGSIIGKDLSEPVAKRAASILTGIEIDVKSQEAEANKFEPADASNHSPRVTPAADAPVAPRSDGR